MDEFLLPGFGDADLIFFDCLIQIVGKVLGGFGRNSPDCDGGVVRLLRIQIQGVDVIRERISPHRHQILKRKLLRGLSVKDVYIIDPSL